MQRYIRNQRGATPGEPSIAPEADEMSRAVAGLQKLNIDGAPGGHKIRAGPVEHSKEAQNSARIKSLQIGPGTGSSPTISVTNNAGNSIPPLQFTPRVTFSQTQQSGHRLGLPSAAGGSKASAYTNLNWRGSQQPAYQRPERSNANPNPMTHLSNSRMKYAKAFYQPGMIVRAYLHEPDFMDTKSTFTVEPSARSITPSQFGNIHTKERKMVIVACHQLNYVALPVYTHGGKGLANKDPDEFISIRDDRDTSSDFRALSKHGALETQFIQKGIRLYDPKSTVQITYPVSRSYDNPVVFEGKIGTKSLNHLIRLVHEYAPRALPTR